MRRLFGYSVFGVFGTRALGALTGILVARALGPAQRGEYGLLVAITGVLGVIGLLGMDVWIVRVVASSATSTVDAARVASTQLRRLTAVTAVVAVPAFLVLDQSALAAAALIVANGASVCALAMLGGGLRMRRVALAQVIGSLVYLVGVGALWVANIATVAWVMTAAAVSTAAIALVAGLAWLQTGRGDEGLRREAHTVGWPVMIGEVLSLATYRADLVLIAGLLSATDAGIYAVAASLSELLWIVPNGIAQALLPSVATVPDPPATARVFRLSLLIGIASATALSIAGFWAVPWLFGTQFSGARLVLVPLCAAGVLLGGWKVLIADLGGRGDTRIRARSAGVALVFMLTADVALIPIAGLRGAAAGSVLAYAVALVITAKRWSEMTGMAWPSLVSSHWARTSPAEPAASS